MFDVNNGVAKIDGKKGIYSDKVTNPSVMYGRNAVQNLYSYFEQPLVNDNNATPPILDFGVNPNAADKNIEQMENYAKQNDAYLNSLPPLEYEYRYMPNIHRVGEIDKDALLGAAYEEMGQRTEVSVNELDNTFGLGDEYSSGNADLNKDGKVDIGEYGATILAADILSKPAEGSELSKYIDGTINSDGHKGVQELTKKCNAEFAAKMYGELYNKYNLASEAKKFNPN